MPTVEVMWTPDTASPADEYAVYYRPREDPPGLWLPAGSTRGNRLDIEFSKVDDAYDVAVAPIVAGVEADDDDWSVTTYRPTTAEDLVAPAAVTNLAVAQQDGNVIATWTGRTDPNTDHFEIREGSTWVAGVKVATAAADADSKSFGWRSSGGTTYTVAAVSSDGRYGAASDAVIITIQAEQYVPTQATVDEHSAGFLGTKTDTEVQGGTGDLIIEAVPATIDAASSIIIDAALWTIEWPNKTPGTYVTAAVDVGSIVVEKIDADIDLTVTAVIPTIDNCRFVIDPIENAAGAISPGTRSPAAAVTIDGQPVDGYSVKVEIDTAQDGVPTWDGYRLWSPGAYYTYRQVRLRVTLTHPWYDTIGVSGFTWKRRRQNRKDEKTVSIVGTGGTSLTWDTVFTAAPNVVVTSIGATAYYATAESITASGCDVRAWDAAGSEQGTATVHVLAMGV